MCSAKDRIKTYLKVSIEEINLIEKMSAGIKSPQDFGQSITGMTVFRACGMSIQYITENFIKIRNKVTADFFSSYKQVPWKAVFGMRNVIAHEYTDIDDEAVFNTIHNDMPVLKETAEKILADLDEGKLDRYIND
ncbi:putative uncharacterized protein [Bacteroides sp. CAG:545]|nr:putative uncharacterized protein [Bacteroides sp. CAG:545]